MKKLVLLVAGLAAVAVLAAPPFNQSVGTTSQTIAPARPLQWTAWAAGSVAQGDVVKTGGYYYFAVVGGTSVAAPTHTSGEETDNDVTWRVVSTSRAAVAITVQTISANGGAINVSFGASAAVKDKGVRLVGEGATFLFDSGDNYNGAIQIVSATGSNVVVGVQEF